MIDNCLNTLNIRKTVHNFINTVKYLNIGRHTIYSLEMYRFWLFKMIVSIIYYYFVRSVFLIVFILDILSLLYITCYVKYREQNKKEKIGLQEMTQRQRHLPPRIMIELQSLGPTSGWRELISKSCPLTSTSGL